MKLSRNFTVIINWMMDQLIPPIIRDAKWFMWLPMKLFAGGQARQFMDFKDRAYDMSEEEFRRAYEVVPSIVDRDTDLNTQSVERILASVIGKKVLEAGCGKGFLAKKMADRFIVTACDIVIDRAQIDDEAGITFEEAALETLPYDDKSFDTVVCTHTLEHVIDFQAAVNELRRVTKQRLIIVVPKERPYKYTFSLHLHFFPYKHTLLHALGKVDGVQECEEVGGDWFYTETYVSINV